MHTTKAETSRANAQHSTGAKTPEGKRRSSLNALRHALTGLTVVLPTDDLDAYRHFVRAFHAELNPEGLFEHAAAQTIADTHWRLNRIRTMENNLFASGFTEFSDQVLVEDQAIHAALAQAKALELHADVLTKLSLYEQRLTRTLEKAHAELNHLQTERKWRERNKPSSTSRIATPPPPAGFEFSSSAPAPTAAIDAEGPDRRIQHQDEPAAPRKSKTAPGED